MSKNNTTPQLRPKFWERFDLSELSHDEWEALCDGCGRCCTIKLEDADTGELQYTNISCRLFNAQTCRCGNYALRKQLVAGCVQLTAQNIDRCAYWMPSTCAYRLLHEGSKLPKWHPLISGRQDSVIEAGISVAGKTVAEFEVDEDAYEDFIYEGFQ